MNGRVSPDPADAAPPRIVVRAVAERDVASARDLAARVGATFAAAADDGEPAGTSDPLDADRLADGAWTLHVDGPRRTLARPDGARLELDFTAGRSAARQRESGLAEQPLARAVGLRRLRRRLGRAPSVVEATGGLGRDAWFVASLGCPVTMIERSPLVHALLEAALARAASEPATAATAARVTLLRGEATALLPTLAREAIDVAYLDPMYPPRRRRAAPTKGMQFLHALLGAGQAGGQDRGQSGGQSGIDAALLDVALATATCQVTVKRPSGAPPLPGAAGFTGQRSTIESPGTRYDVYHLG